MAAGAGTALAGALGAKHLLGVSLYAFLGNCSLWYIKIMPLHVMNFHKLIAL